MRYWVMYFAAIMIAASVLPIIAQSSVVGDTVPMIAVCDNGKVCKMTVEEYTLLALIAQGDSLENAESKKALAVSIRSCAMYFSLYGCKHDDFDVCTDASCCIALGSPDEIKSEALQQFTSAVEETKGQILTLNSMPALALFTLCASKGTQQCEEIPYLTPVAEAERCEIHKTELEYDMENDIAELFGGYTEETPYLVYDENEKCVLGILGGKIIEGNELANKLSLPTVELTAEVSENKLRAVGYGAGHGYGLNLCGAEKLSESGFEYEKILEIYYPKLLMNKMKYR